jgi:hypothetical protein
VTPVIGVEVGALGGCTGGFEAGGGESGGEVGGGDDESGGVWVGGLVTGGDESGGVCVGGFEAGGDESGGVVGADESGGVCVGGVVTGGVVAGGVVVTGASLPLAEVPELPPPPPHATSDKETTSTKPSFIVVIERRPACLQISLSPSGEDSQAACPEKETVSHGAFDDVGHFEKSPVTFLQTAGVLTRQASRMARRKQACVAASRPSRRLRSPSLRDARRGLVMRERAATPSATNPRRYKSAGALAPPYEAWPRLRSRAGLPRVPVRRLRPVLRAFAMYA